LSAELKYRADNPGILRIYDIAMDDFRDATQRDIDLLCAAANNWGATKQAIEDLATATHGLHKKYMERVKTATAEFVD
jgi:hypothetical protein